MHSLNLELAAELAIYGPYFASHPLWNPSTFTAHAAAGSLCAWFGHPARYSLTDSRSENKAVSLSQISSVEQADKYLNNSALIQPWNTAGECIGTLGLLPALVALAWRGAMFRCRIHVSDAASPIRGAAASKLPYAQRSAGVEVARCSLARWERILGGSVSRAWSLGAAVPL
mmetsp:Transcript_61437/g.165032  ORF Transcript_61437/g.165032 Transcript_61437/m.165032 type:complete len:172 (+) Transcript_61437:35-550(+)